ncbi:hypothetical protein QFZ77_003210 [Paenibacillus sp. V4I3]|nr:hypothetical protein [Paenibacillus sp. V4I3]MDQ0874551.1 hypothetical protein [Paenibacillus sp. V4I3]
MITTARVRRGKVSEATFIYTSLQNHTPAAVYNHDVVFTFTSE